MKKILLIILIFAISCTKEEITEKTIIGKWYIYAANPMGILLNEPNRKSYLQFNKCDSFCNGSDFRSKDNSTGNFEYYLSDDQKTFRIVVLSEIGGDWSGVWKIDSFTATELTISSEHKYGIIVYKLIKNEK